MHEMKSEDVDWWNEEELEENHGHNDIPPVWFIPNARVIVFFLVENAVVRVGLSAQIQAWCGATCCG